MKKMIFLILLTSCLVLAMNAYSSDKDKNPKKQSTQTTKGANYEERGTQQSPFFVRVIPSLKSPEDSAYEKYEHHTKPFYERLGTIANVCIAIITLVLAGLNVGLWLSTKKSADAAKKAADAAKASADDLPKVERAYLSVSISTDVESWKSAKASELSPIKIGVTNFGRTPAKVMEIITKMQIFKSDDGITASPGTLEKDKIISAAGRYVASNSMEEFFYDVHVLVIIDEWKGIEVGDYDIIFSGEVKYKDIFEKDHIAYFNWWLRSGSYQRGFYINDPELNYTT